MRLLEGNVTAQVRKEAKGKERKSASRAKLTEKLRKQKKQERRQQEAHEKQLKKLERREAVHSTKANIEEAKARRRKAQHVARPWGSLLPSPHIEKRKQGGTIKKRSHIQMF